MGKMEKIEKYIAKGNEGKLLKLINDKDMDVRLAAIDGLSRIGQDGAFNALIAMLTDDNAAVRAAGARGLGQMKNEHAKAHLAHRLELEKDESVLASLKAAIAALHGTGF